MLTGWNVIIVLKIAVVAVTVILAASLVALAKGHRRLHGRLNLVFMILTLTAVFGLEFLIRVVEPGMFDKIFDAATKRIMVIHLSFSVPSALLLPIMYFTGRSGRRSLHILLACLFSVAWIGTFITGVFYLPHSAP